MIQNQNSIAQTDKHSVQEQQIIIECNELQLNDSLSCYNYMECRKSGSLKSQYNKSNAQLEEKKSSSLATELNKRLKAEDDKKKKAEEEYQKRMTEEYQKQQSRCYSGVPQPGCPNYQPPIYDKSGRRIY